jgi:hypothetical protein
VTISETMKRTIRVVVWGVGGILLMGALTGATVAAAGKDIARPAKTFSLVSRVHHPTRGSDDASIAEGSGTSGKKAPQSGSGGDEETHRSSGSSSGSSPSKTGSSATGSSGSGSSASGDSQGSGNDDQSGSGGAGTSGDGSGDGGDGGPDD